MRNLKFGYKTGAITCLMLSICISSYAHASTKNSNFYISGGMGFGSLINKTFDKNDPEYKYDFSNDVSKASIIAGKHVSEKLDVFTELNSFSTLKHQYKGTIMTSDPQPKPKATIVPESERAKYFDPVAPYPMSNLAVAEQNIKANTITVGAKYNFKPAALSHYSKLYLKGGVGMSFNKSSDYTRTLGQTLQIIQPGRSISKMAFSVGTGVSISMKSLNLNIGYDLHNIGKFKTKDLMIFKSYVTNKDIQSFSGAEYGKVTNKGLLLGTLNVSLGVDF